MTFAATSLALYCAATSAALCAYLVTDKLASATCGTLAWSLLTAANAATGLHNGLADHGTVSKVTDFGLWSFTTAVCAWAAWNRRKDQQKLQAAAREKAALQDGTGGGALAGTGDDVRDPAGNIRAAVDRAARGEPGPAVYASLMADLGQENVRSRVRDLYAQVVADNLRSHPCSEILVPRLEQEDADPELVVDHLGLPQGALGAELRSRLTAVTGDDATARALALLISPELGERAWAWLAGEPGIRLPAEYRIQGSLADSVPARKALSAIARLYGQPAPGGGSGAKAGTGKQHKTGDGRPGGNGCP